MCTSGAAWWKGRQNLESVRCLGKTVLHTCSDLFKPCQNFSHLFPPVHICSHLFTIVPTCSYLFLPLHTCSHLFTAVPTCYHLFTPVHTCSDFSDYLRSSRNGTFSLNFPLAKAVFFDLTCYLVEIAYFCSPNRELSNCVRLLQLYRKKCQSLKQPIQQ